MRNLLGVVLIALPILPVLVYALVCMLRELGWRAAVGVWSFAMIATASIAAGAWLLDS